MGTDETNELLREIVNLLRIVARPQVAELRERFKAAMLSSAKRQQMWDAMDGNKTLADIAREVGTSAEAVRLFVRDVEEGFADLIDSGGNGPQRPRRRLI